MESVRFQTGDRLMLSLHGRPEQAYQVAHVFPAALVIVAEDGTAELVSPLQASRGSPCTAPPSPATSPREGAMGSTT